MFCAKLNYSLVKLEISVRSLVVAIVMVFHSFLSAVVVVFVYLRGVQIVELFDVADAFPWLNRSSV